MSIIIDRVKVIRTFGYLRRGVGGTKISEVDYEVRHPIALFDYAVRQQTDWALLGI
jgi:hypothetical protein